MGMSFLLLVYDNASSVHVLNRFFCVYGRVAFTKIGIVMHVGMFFLEKYTLDRGRRQKVGLLCASRLLAT